MKELFSPVLFCDVVIKTVSVDGVPTTLPKLEFKPGRLVAGIVYLVLGALVGVFVI